MSVTRYGVLHRDGSWWGLGGRNYWVGNPLGARSYMTWDAAELAALREIPDPITHWSVRLLPEPPPQAARVTP